MEPAGMVDEVQRWLRLVSIRSIEHLATTHADSLYQGVAADLEGLVERVQIRVAKLSSGEQFVRISGDSGLAVECVSTEGLREALLGAATKWESRQILRANGGGTTVVR